MSVPPTPDFTNRHDVAASYAQRGWAVIPLHWIMNDGRCSCATGPNPCDDSFGKHPLRTGWTTGGRLSSADLYAIWAEDTPQANIGIRTGTISDFFVLDVDPKSDGFDSLAKLQADFPLPATYVVKTGSGGYHYYFAMPDFAVRNGANRELLKKYGPGLDIRGDGGQVVAAGSRTDRGVYVVQVDAPIVAAPEALLALLRAATSTDVDNVVVEDLPVVAELGDGEAARVQNYAEKVVAAEVAAYRAAKPGTGNDTLFRSACSAIEIAQSPWNTITVSDVQARLLITAQERRRTHPLGGGQGDAEFNQVWRSARSKTVGQGRALPVNLSEGLAFDPFPRVQVDDPFANSAVTPTPEPVVAPTPAVAVTDNPFAAPAVRDDDAGDEPAQPSAPPVVATVAPVVERAIATPASVPESDETGPVRTLSTLPAEFYDRRAWLRDLRTFTYDRMESPDAVLISYLARVASQMPAGLHLHTSIGAPITASLYAILVGPSGTGKTSGDSIAEMLHNATVQPKGLSTGEGLIEAFWGLSKTQDPETLKFTTERARTSTNQLFVLDEGKALLQMANRIGNITGEVLRSAWSGGYTGQHNATKELQRQLDARTYNLGLVMGMQYEVAADLLLDTETGMAQRFLLAPVLDPNMKYTQGNDKPFDDVLNHAVHPDYVQMPAPAFLGGSVMLDLTPMTMTLDSDIRERLRHQHWLKKTGQITVDEHDSQRPAAICKLAMVLTYLDGANKVTEDVWDMATQIYDNSAAIRDQLLEMAAERKREEKLALAHERARERQAVSRYGNDQADITRTVLKWIADGKDTRRAIIKNAKGARRELLADVLAQLVKNKHLAEVNVGNRQIKYERLTDWVP